MTSASQVKYRAENVSAVRLPARFRFTSSRGEGLLQASKAVGLATGQRITTPPVSWAVRSSVPRIDIPYYEI